MEHRSWSQASPRYCPGCKSSESNDGLLRTLIMTETSLTIMMNWIRSLESLGHIKYHFFWALCHPLQLLIDNALCINLLTFSRPISLIYLALPLTSKQQRHFSLRTTPNHYCSVLCLPSSGRNHPAPLGPYGCPSASLTTHSLFLRAFHEE